MDDRGYICLEDRQDSHERSFAFTDVTDVDDTATNNSPATDVESVHNRSKENEPSSMHGKVLKVANVANLEELERYEITLVNGQKSFIYVPVPLPYGEKERLKKYIDLILEEPNPNIWPERNQET
ncbi:MAG: hypothetical protein AAGF01_04590 [Cyanobacteria bacterium P01_G01_bin.38]